MFSSHSSEPMVNERRLPDTCPGNNGNDVDILLCPSTIQKSDVFLSAKNIASCNGQSGYGNSFWSESCRRPAGSDARSGTGRFLQTLTSDSTPRVDSVRYPRYHLQQLVRSPETLCRIFLKEFLKENYNRLWNIFESLKW